MKWVLHQGTGTGTYGQSIVYANIYPANTSVQV